MKKVRIAGQRATTGGNSRDQFGSNSSWNSNISITRGLSHVNQGMRKNQGNRFELDSHADTCVLGKDFHILELTTELYDATAYDQNHTCSKVPVGLGVMAYDDPGTGATTLL